jgi:hypothetical protein
MISLYREFTLVSPAVWDNLKAFVKSNAKACVESGKPLKVIVTQDENKRNKEQNRRLFGYLYKTISEQAWVDGKQFSKKVWHEYYAEKYGYSEEIMMPDGTLKTIRKSTSDMTVGEFADYMTHIEMDAASELGIEWNG